MGDAVWEAIVHPVAERVARRCDACLRIGGASQGADAMWPARNRRSAASFIAVMLRAISAGSSPVPER